MGQLKRTVPAHGAGQHDGSAAGGAYGRFQRTRSQPALANVAAQTLAYGHRFFVVGMLITTPRRPKACPDVRLNWLHPLAIPLALLLILVSPILAIWIASIMIWERIGRPTHA